MKNKHLFITLAFQNIKKNAQFYTPYILAFIITIAVYYNMYAIKVNKGIAKMSGGDSLKVMLSLGTGVVAIFAVIFLFYSNSFVTKRRQKEFGLYHILGMEKRHIAKVLLVESFMVAFYGFVGGVVTGIIFNRLLLMALAKMIKMNVTFPFEIQYKVIVSCGCLVAGVFALTMLYNLFMLLKLKTVDLLNSDKSGEKEPKTKWIMALIGVICIGVGYYISITTKKPLAALSNFFIAVILVIIGTYFLFIAVSIVVLKMLKKNKNYYYQTRHFTSVSGMIYRMKQNAAGLASICILSTMVLVTISTTVCLYLGINDAVETRFPYDFLVSYSMDDTFNQAKADQKVLDIIKKDNSITASQSYTYLSFPAKYENGDFHYSKHNNFGTPGAHVVVVLTKDDYKNASGKTINLNSDEVIVCDQGEKTPKQFHIFNQKFTVLKYDNQLSLCGLDNAYLTDMHYVIVASEAIRAKLYQDECKMYGAQMQPVQYEIDVNVKSNTKAQIATTDKLQKVFCDQKRVQIEGKETNRDFFRSMYGGFLFLGLFLGFIFLMATTLIIYYKQISEGYDDQKRFEIMQKVGMTQKEVKSSIHSQILIVFFFPLLIAGVHVAAAFPMMKRLLCLLNLSNTSLFIWCVLATFAIFAIIYFIVYSATSKVYYKIVQ